MGAAALCWRGRVRGAACLFWGGRVQGGNLVMVEHACDLVDGGHVMVMVMHAIWWACDVPMW